MRDPDGRLKPDKVGCRKSQQTPLALALAAKRLNEQPAPTTPCTDYTKNHTPEALDQKVLFTISATWLTDVFTVDGI